MSEIPLGSSYLRFFDQGGAVDEPKFVDEPIDQMANIGGPDTPLQDVPTPIDYVSDPNPDYVQTDIPEFIPDLENPVGLGYDEPEPMDEPEEELASAYDQLLEADLRLRLERATPLERHLYEVTGMEPGLDRATILPVSGSKEGKDLQWSMPSLFYDLAKVANAPGAVVQGIPVSDDETVELGMNMMGSGLAIGPSVEGAVAGMAIKNKGGNWRDNFSPDRGTKRLRKTEVDFRPADIAINKFIDTKLNKYIRNDMATPEDPLRRLIDQGQIIPPEALHPVEGDKRKMIGYDRRSAGFPEEGYATTEGGRGWEDATDIAISSNKASIFTGGSFPEDVAASPWLTHLDPATPVYSFYGSFGRELGFEDLVDDLYASMITNGIPDLPQHLRITPKDLDRMSLVEAVERVAQIEQWKIKQANDRTYAALTNKATVPYREYDTVPYTAGATNDRGLGWKEIKLTDDTPEAIAAFDEAIFHEKESMGHSLGGYMSPDGVHDGGSSFYGLGGIGAIKAGHVRLYSVRDAKGGPHVTIEVKTATHPTNNSGKDEINQIKGPSNRKPIDKYQTFIEDFIQSEDWGAVRDLHNTNLTFRDDLPYEQLTDPRLPPDQKYFSNQELYDMFEPDAGAAINPEGFSRGGEVSKTAWEEINGY